jgi:hypothetical protein
MHSQQNIKFVQNHGPYARYKQWKSDVSTTAANRANYSPPTLNFTNRWFSYHRGFQKRNPHLNSRLFPSYALK